MGGPAAPAYTGAGRKGQLRNELYECRGDTNWERLCLLSGKTAVSSLLKATRYQYMPYSVGEDILELGCQCGDIIAHMCKVVKRDGVSSRAIASYFGRQNSRRRAPTRGAPTDCVWRPGEGTHKGRPYRLRLAPWGGYPQGAPLPIRLALGRAPTRGAPTDSFGPGEGTHKGCPYRFVWPWEGHPQGVPLPIRLALGRAPTRGAPTDSFGPGEGAPARFRQPHVGLSQFDAIALSSRGMEFRGVVQTIGQPLSETGFAGLLQHASHATEAICSTFIDRPLPFYRPTLHRCHHSG